MVKEAVHPYLPFTYCQCRRVKRQIRIYRQQYVKLQQQRTIHDRKIQMEHISISEITEALARKEDRLEAMGFRPHPDSPLIPRFRVLQQIRLRAACQHSMDDLKLAIDLLQGVKQCATFILRQQWIRRQIRIVLPSTSPTLCEAIRTTSMTSPKLLDAYRYLTDWVYPEITVEIPSSDGLQES